MKVFKISMLLLLFGIITCTKKEEKGTVTFYTNAQMVLNCGTFDVDVKIENEQVGKLSQSVPFESVPKCGSMTSDSILSIQKNVGSYKYTAIFCNNNILKGHFEITKNGCVSIFLDAYKVEAK